MTLSNFLTIIIFVAINIAILFFIKTRTTRVIGLISSHLAIIFLFDIYLKSFINFKEIVLVISVYSMVILFLISNNKSFLNDICDNEESSKKYNFLKFQIPIAIMIIGTTICILLIAISLPSVNKVLAQKKLTRTNELEVNPLILPSHPVHIAVKKFYLGKKFNDGDTSDAVSLALEKNERKRAKLKDSLSENIILKRTSDIILIIVASLTALLILSNKKINENLE